MGAARVTRAAFFSQRVTTVKLRTPGAPTIASLDELPRKAAERPVEGFRSIIRRIVAPITPREIDNVVIKAGHDPEWPGDTLKIPSDGSFVAAHAPRRVGAGHCRLATLNFLHGRRNAL